MLLTRDQALAYRNAGAALLDRQEPTWADLIDLAALDMEDCDACVLGQVYGDFGEGMRELFPYYFFADRDAIAVAHGFDVPRESFSDVSVRTWQKSLADTVANFALMREVWEALIRERQMAVSAPEWELAEV